MNDNVLVGLAVVIASYRRGGREDRAARRAVGSAATAAERGARAVVAARARACREGLVSHTHKRALARPKRARRPFEAEHKRACESPRVDVWSALAVVHHVWVREAP